MRLWSVFRKTMLEQGRDLLGLSLTLVFAPLFVFLYWLFFPSGSTTYGVLVLNQDVGYQLADGQQVQSGREVILALEALQYENGDPLLEVSTVAARAEADRPLRDRDAEVLLILPPGFSQALAQAGASPATVTFIGDLTNPYYAVAAIMTNVALDQTVQAASGQARPVEVVEEALGASAARSEFEVYVPGLLIFAEILLIFLAAMTVAREVESGGLRRLQITPMTALDYLGGITAGLVLVGVVALLLTFLAAWSLGFRSQGPLGLAILAGALTSISTIGIGLVIACFSKTVNQAFLLANFPLGFLMFFSGAVFPVPRIPLFTLAGRSIGLYDILPATHAVSALNKVMSLGAGLGEVAFELSALLVLSALYFGIGVWLFQRRHLQAR